MPKKGEKKSKKKDSQSEEPSQQEEQPSQQTASTQEEGKKEKVKSKRGKRTQRKAPEHMNGQLKKLIKSIHKDTGCGKDAIVLLNALAVDFAQRVSREASLITTRAKHRTVNPLAVDEAISLVLKKSDLRTDIKKEALQSVERYQASQV